MRRRATATRAARSDGHGEPERLQKVLSRTGLASRREVEAWIRAGRLTVNGTPAVLGVRVRPGDQVRLDGRLIRQRPAAAAPRVFLCHRSPGENLREPPLRASTAPGEVAADSATANLARTSRAAGAALLDRLPRRAGRRYIAVSPMPRIDGGLEVVTSSGDLAASLQRGVRRLLCEFSVRVHGELTDRQVEGILGGALDRGVRLEVERCEAAGGEGSNRWYAFAGRGASGKDVRQLFERNGAMVSRVLRTRLGSLALERRLARGQFRELTQDELAALLGEPGAADSPAAE